MLIMVKNNSFTRLTHAYEVVRVVCNSTSDSTKELYHF